LQRFDEVFVINNMITKTVRSDIDSDFHISSFLT
jgi:hypothetical protein